jgi:uncharacterized protein YbcI
MIDGRGGACEARLGSSVTLVTSANLNSLSMSDSEPLRGGELNAAVTREVIRIQSESHGRGPKKAFSFHNGNVLVTVLEEVLSPAERKLAGNGQGEAVLQIRRLYQSSMAAEMKERIEAVTGRRVTALMSDNQVDPDVAVEVFILDRPLA